MKNKFNVIVALALALVMCTFAFTACSNTDTEPGETEKSVLKESEIITALSDSDGTLDGTLTVLSGTSEDVKSFSYVLKGVNASKLKDKSFTR